MGMTPCDMVVRPNDGTLRGSNWDHNVWHLRHSHWYWIVVRNGRRCDRRGAHLTRFFQ